MVGEKNMCIYKEQVHNQSMVAIHRREEQKQYKSQTTFDYRG